MSPLCVAIIDPYSSGALLADALVARGAVCVAVESTPSLTSAMKSHFNPRTFREVICHHGDLDATLRAVARHEPCQMIAGFESGVELADELAYRLELPGNAPQLSAARRDKFLMTEAVKRRGLRTARQFQSADIDQLIEWIGRQLQWPVIVKPPKSVASDRVHCCHNSDELRDAAVVILSEVNVLGLRNSAPLVQEFLHGTEYAVDTVSCSGKTRLTAVWQYERPSCAGAFICYDAMRLLSYEGGRQAALREYALQVLEALGIGFGPAHCEVMWTADGPVLVEAGARMSAGVNAVLSRVCGGICQLDETVDVLLDPDAFRARGDVVPRLERQAVNVFLMPRRPGVLIGTRHIDTLQRLPTLHSLSLATQPGERLQRVAGRVTLVHESHEAIECDIATIRALERDGIFQVQETADAP